MVECYTTADILFLMPGPVTIKHLSLWHDCIPKLQETGIAWIQLIVSSVAEVSFVITIHDPLDDTIMENVKIGTYTAWKTLNTIVVLLYQLEEHALDAIEWESDDDHPVEVCCAWRSWWHHKPAAWFWTLSMPACKSHSSMQISHTDASCSWHIQRHDMTGGGKAVQKIKWSSV